MFVYCLFLPPGVVEEGVVAGVLAGRRREAGPGLRQRLEGCRLPVDVAAVEDLELLRERAYTSN